MKLAFTMLVHKNPGQAVALARAVTRAGNYCLIHCNSLSGPGFRAEIEAGLRRNGITTARLMRSEPVAWGTGSIWRVELRAIDELLGWANDWSHLTILSGQCLPTKPPEEMADLLASHPRTSFVECMDLEVDRPHLKHRLDRYYVELGHKLWNTRIPRRLPPQPKIYFGAFWSTLSRQACEYVTRSDEAKRLQRYLKFVMFPDELYFQTLLLNSHLRDSVVRDSKRLMIWDGNGGQPLVLKSEHWPVITDDRYLFARKFDPAIDVEVMRKLGDKTGCDFNDCVATHAARQA